MVIENVILMNSDPSRSRTEIGFPCSDLARYTHVGFQYPRYRAPWLALMSTNKQTCNEVMDILAKLEKHPVTWTLDWSYIGDRELWSQWTSVPFLTDFVDTLKVNLTDLDSSMSFESSRRHLRGKLMMHSIKFNNYVMMFATALSMVLRAGPIAASSRVQKLPYPPLNVPIRRERHDMAGIIYRHGLKVNKLIINVLPTPEPEVPNMQAYPTGEHHPAPEGQEYFRQHFGPDWKPESANPGMIAAEAMCEFLVEVMASILYEYSLFSETDSAQREVLGRVITTEIQLAGKTRHVFNWKDIRNTWTQYRNNSNLTLVNILHLTYSQTLGYFPKEVILDKIRTANMLDDVGDSMLPLIEEQKPSDIKDGEDEQ